MQFSAAIAARTSCDKYSLVLGNLYFASDFYRDDAGDTVSSQEELVLLKLLNKSISTYYVLTSFTQQLTHMCDRGADTNKIPGRQLPFYSKFHHAEPPRVCFPAATVRRGAHVYISLTGQLVILKHWQM